ncbi:DUF3077 domain-containing protein [Pseudomonas sp. App30]|uniref:DUF6124 family protein n=1 Tax=Pseudomonas sp. App30 TaxID=3068990 RepID=UPI003A8139B0
MNDALTNRALPASLFRVRDDVSAEEVLLHLSEVLRVGEAAAYELTENPGFNAGGLALAVVHAMEAAQVLVGRLLEMEAA